MNSDRNARSSDLEQARALSDALGGRNRRRATPSPPERIPGRYVQFRAARAGAAGAPAPSPRDLTAMPELHALGTEGTWDDWLEALRSVLGCRAAWLVDTHGLLIGAAGDVSPNDAETCGARLIAALEQAEHLAAGAPDQPTVVSLELGSRCLTGFATDAAGTRVIQVLSGSAPVRPSHCEHVVTVLRHRLELRPGHGGA